MSNCTHWALFSGGHDSLASTHYSMENGDAEAVLHLDTTTGIPQNEAFVRNVCERYDWPLRVERAPITLYEFAVRYGFPGSAAHSWAYRYLKERQLGRVATDTNGKPRYITGVRKHESQRRMRTVKSEIQEADRWIWQAPMFDRRDHEVDAYLSEHDLPTNPVVETIHRSGECNCGAFANRDEELALLEAHYPNFADWLLTVEGYVQLEIGNSEPYCWWGHSSLPSPKLRELIHRHDTPQMTLCEDCLWDAADPDEVSR